jgi:hypothetical protein
MKLSEAIRLGSTILTPQAGGQHFAETQSGCALGMAAIARGCTFHLVPGPIIADERRTLGVEGVWGKWILTPMVRPCYCWWVRVPRKMRVKDIIAHLFDYHVMFKRNWTFERLVAWVETVEPVPAPANIEPVKRVSLEALRFQAQMRETERGFLGHSPRIQQREDPEIWQARVAAFVTKYANRSPKERAAARAAEMAAERLAVASEASAATEEKSLYEPWISPGKNANGTSGAPAAAAVYRH